MRNLKIGVRLGLGFACMVVLIVVMTVLAFVELHKIETQVDNITKRDLPEVHALTNSLVDIQNVCRSVSLIVAVEDPAFRDTEQKYIETQRAHYKESFKKLEEMEKSEQGKTLIEKIKGATANLAAVNNKIILFCLSGNQREADMALKTEWTPALQAMMATFGDMSKYMDEKTAVSENEAATAYKSAASGLIISCIIAILIAIACAILITRSIIVPIGRMRDMIHDIARGEGDLTKRLDASSKDEIGEASLWFNTFVDKLHGIINRISEATHQVASASTELNATAQMMANGSEEVSVQAGTVATAGEEMSATSGDIARNCLCAAEGSKQASEAAITGAKVVDKTIAVMNSITVRVTNSARAVESLGSRSDQIGQIVETIEDIADQTNLLALNAAIEAARAGEQGRGFAVVADEVRALAERTTRATREIGEMIKAIQHETKGAVTAMEEGVSEVAKGTETAANSGKALEQILDQVNSVTMQIAQVATAAEQQTSTTSEISNNMQQITDAVAQTASGALQSAAAAEQLSGLADELRNIVGQFKL